MTHNNEAYLDTHALMNFLKCISTDDIIRNQEFNVLFLCIGLQNSHECYEHTEALRTYNKRYKAILKTRKKDLRVVTEDKNAVAKLWSASINSLQQSQMNVEFCFELAKILLDQSTSIQQAFHDISHLLRYHLNLNFHQDDNVMSTYHGQLKKEAFNQYAKYMTKLPPIIEHIRTIMSYYKDCLIYGHKGEEIVQNDKVIFDSTITLHLGQSVYDKLFSHSNKLAQKHQIYHYQRELEELKKCTFKPEKISHDPKRQNNNSPYRSKTPNKVTNNDRVTPKKKQASVSPNQGDIKNVKGYEEAIDRMKKARDMMDKKQNYWIDRSAELTRKNTLPVKEFKLSTHDFPHAKPVMMVDVELTPAKRQRIGLYGSNKILLSQR